MNWEKLKQHVQDAWNFLAHDESWTSYLANLVLAFIIIKYLFFPALSLVTGTQLPVVAVISNSMQHSADWWEEPALCETRCTQKEFYEDLGIDQEEFESYPLDNGFNRGDIVFVRGTDKDSLEVGDVIVFQSGRNYPIIHRVIITEDTYLVTKGDNNRAPIRTAQLNEANVSYDAVIGEAYFKIPWLGYIKVLFTDLLRFIT